MAAAAGVSTATVSNAFNRPERMSAAVRERVLAAAAAVGYLGPDPAARALRSRTAGSIGVLFTGGLTYGFSDPYCSALLTGIAAAAEAAHTSLVLLPMVPWTARPVPGQVQDSIAAVQRAAVDGLVADGIHDAHPALPVLRARGVPIIRSVAGCGDRCVVVDDFAAARGVGEHIAALGHRRVAVVTGFTLGPAAAARDADAGDDVDAAPTVDALFPYARRRMAGVRAGLPPRAELSVVGAGRNTRDAGRTAGEGLLRSPTPPTAIVAESDVLALGVLDACSRRGLRPGVDVSVTGFDDIPAAEAAGLTTVAQPIEDKGRLMARMLLDPTCTDRRINLPTELIVRSSTGPAPDTRRAT